MQGLQHNLQEHAVPEEIFDVLADDYEGFLAARRQLMAAKIRAYFDTL